MTLPPLESTSTTYHLPVSVMRALNMLHNAPKHCRRVRWLAENCNIDLDDVGKLFRHALVDTQDGRGNFIDVDTASAAVASRAYVKLTPAGCGWVATNPFNQVLRRFGEDGRRTLTLHRLMAPADTSETIIRWAVDGGLLVLYAADAPDRPTSPTYGVFQAPRSHTARLTARGRHAVGL